MANELVLIDNRPLSATLKNEPAFTVKATEHPAEKGANVIDHARPQLDTLSIEGVVAAKPPEAPVQWDQLLVGLAKQPRPVRIVTARHDHQAMLLTSYRPKEEAKYGEALHFTADFIEFRTANVRSQVVKVVRGQRVQKGRTSDHKFKAPKRTVAGALSGNFAKSKLDLETRGQTESSQ